MQCLKSELARCIRRDALFKKELESLVGLLQFVTKVVRPGCCFLRRLYSMKCIGLKPNHHIYLNIPAIADITWWHLFISTWNGISMLWDTGAKKADFTVTSDASGSWGCGAFCMVPFSVVGQTSSLVYRYKGDDTNSGGCSYLWEGVVYQNCRISCGQHGSSTHSQCHFLLRWSFDALNQASSVFRVIPQFLVLCLSHRRAGKHSSRCFIM